MSAAGLSVNSETLHRIAAMGLHFRCDGITIVIYDGYGLHWHTVLSPNSEGFRIYFDTGKFRVYEKNIHFTVRHCIILQKI